MPGKFGYTMDDRKFPYSEKIEYKEIVGLKKVGTEFYISREDKENHVIFRNDCPEFAWFNEKQYPELFKSFDKLYKELGENDYRLYGYRDLENPDDIKFFDLKILSYTTSYKTFSTDVYFYHDDFMKLCSLNGIQTCEEIFKGSFSLKTIKKFLLKNDLAEDEVLFKPLSESNFDIPDEVKTTIVPIVSGKKKNRILNFQKNVKSDVSDEEEKLALMVAKEVSNGCIFENDLLDTDSVYDFTEVYSKSRYDDNYLAELTRNCVEISLSEREEMLRVLKSYIAELIVKASLAFVKYFMDAETYSFYFSQKDRYALLVEDEIETDIKPIISRLINLRSLF